MSRRLPAIALTAIAMLGLSTTSTEAHNMSTTTGLTRFKVPGGPTLLGDSIVILGRLKSADAICNAGVTVGLYQVERTGERLMARDLTDAEGEYVFRRRPRHDVTVVVRFDGFTQAVPDHEHDCGASRSRETSVKVLRGRSGR